MSFEKDLSDAIKLVYMDLFPNSHVSVSKACLGESYFVTTYLGNKGTWFNGIHNNDQGMTLYKVSHDDGNYLVECLGGVSLNVNPKEKYYAMSREKMRFVRKSGNFKKCLDDMRKHFVKYKEFVNLNRDNIYNNKALLDSGII